MPTYDMPVLTRTSPEKQGIASSAILKFIEAVENSGQELHSFMFVRRGCVVAEGWWSPYKPHMPHMMFSLSKSFTSTAVGMAVTEGYFSIEDTVISFFPEDVPDVVTEYLAEMRVRHLLTMTTGHHVRTFPYMYGHKENNWAKGFFEVPLAYKPGVQFFYNTGATYMLSEIIQRTTGMKLMDFLMPRLFIPLGIKNASWLESPQGVNLGGIGLSITTEDIARFGQLYLQKGIWNGKRLLSEAWVREATAAQVSNGDAPNSDWTQGYGYQFWRCQHGLYRGDGSFGQFCIVMDEYDAVLAITGAAKDMQQVMNLVWDYLLPAMQTEPLAADHDGYTRLVEKSSQLNLLPAQGQAVSPKAAQISGKVYTAEPNVLGIKHLILDFTDSVTIFKAQTAQGEERITASFGRWHEGHTSLFNEIWLTGSLPLVASGAWVNDDCYMIVARLYETPYTYTLNCHFEGNKLKLTVQINVSLETTEPIVLTAIC